MAGSRIKVGEIFELPVSSGFVYFHIIGLFRNRWISRISKTVSPSRLSTFDHFDTLDDDSLIIVLGALEHAVKDKAVTKVAEEPVPESIASTPFSFKANNGRLKDGRSQPGCWWIDDGIESKRVGNLEAEEEKLPWKRTVPLLVLGRYIERGWDPDWQFKDPPGKEFQQPENDVDIAFTLKLSELLEKLI